jgi:hypothetical protein
MKFIFSTHFDKSRTCGTLIKTTLCNRQGAGEGKMILVTTGFKAVPDKIKTNWYFYFY